MLKKELSFEIRATCANSGREMKISLDSDLNILSVPRGSEPMFCFPIIQIAAAESPSIVDIF